MKLLLERDILNDECTMGRLSVNGSLWCYTLEDKTRDHKVYGETCIPEGTYKIEMWFWPKYGKTYPHILNVPNFTYILIHKGSTKSDTLGCVLVGMQRGINVIGNCAPAFDSLKGVIEKALEVEEVFIEIVKRDDARDTRTSTI